MGRSKKVLGILVYIFFSMQFSPYWNGARIRAHVLVARMPFLIIGTVNLFYIVSYLIDILGV